MRLLSINLIFGSIYDIYHFFNNTSGIASWIQVILVVIITFFLSPYLHRFKWHMAYYVRKRNDYKEMNYYIKLINNSNINTHGYASLCKISCKSGDELDYKEFKKSKDKDEVSIPTLGLFWSYKNLHFRPGNMELGEPQYTLGLVSYKLHYIPINGYHRISTVKINASYINKLKMLFEKMYFKKYVMHKYHIKSNVNSLEFPSRLSKKELELIKKEQNKIDEEGVLYLTLDFMFVDNKYFKIVNFVNKFHIHNHRLDKLRKIYLHKKLIKHSRNVYMNFISKDLRNC